MVGRARAQAHRPRASCVVAAGHVVGNHTQTHRCSGRATPAPGRARRCDMGAQTLRDRLGRRAATGSGAPGGIGDARGARRGRRAGRADRRVDCRSRTTGASRPRTMIVGGSLRHVRARRGRAHARRRRRPHAAPSTRCRGSSAGSGRGLPVRHARRPVTPPGRSVGRSDLSRAAWTPRRRDHRVDPGVVLLARDLVDELLVEGERRSWRRVAGSSGSSAVVEAAAVAEPAHAASNATPGTSTRSKSLGTRPRGTSRRARGCRSAPGSSVVGLASTQCSASRRARTRAGARRERPRARRAATQRARGRSPRAGRRSASTARARGDLGKRERTVRDGCGEAASRASARTAARAARTRRAARPSRLVRWRAPDRRCRRCAQYALRRTRRGHARAARHGQAMTTTMVAHASSVEDAAVHVARP